MARRKGVYHCIHCHVEIAMVDGTWIHVMNDGQSEWCEKRKDLKTEPAPADHYRCNYCRRIYPQPVRVHSGYRECGRCWDWRKLAGPQTDYWTQALTGIFIQDGKEKPALGSGPDANDLMLWQRWGIKDEVLEAMHVLDALLDRYEILANADRKTREAILYPNQKGANDFG